jgi:chemosensory pili system protein ChpB (putative protein-glutamate methylesterase)
VSASESKRVALLARPGQARERLRGALHEAGAEIVLEDDPNSVDGETLSDSAPQVVLVALEPAIEDSLSRFDAVLHDPSVAVIFDEAELAARREGWEAQRWARHLAAKLHGHRDVLPPGREEEDTGGALQLEPGLPPTPAQLHADAEIDLHLEEAADIAFELPRDGYAFTEVASKAELDKADFSKADFDKVVDVDDWLRVATPPPLPEPPPLPPELPPAENAAPAPKWELSLVDLEPTGASAAAAREPGAVLVFAGIGGPDAVRKLLGELPIEFPKPVLIHLRLDGGRYDNLVRQMARVAPMPVELAEAGKSAEVGRIYVLPGDVTLAVDGGAVNFRNGDNVPEAMAQLPPKDSSVLLLSGSDPLYVEPAMALARQGALVAGQSPDGCYDPAASNALAALGGDTGTPTQLAQRLTDRWIG